METTETTPPILSEAEQLRQAIASGEVDAFLVGKDDKEKRVLLLAGAYQRYRLNADGLVLLS